jgi:ATP-dependent DNA ligase
MPVKRKQIKTALAFIETMECLPVTKMPDGPEWTYEIKLDGFRLEAVKTSGETTLYSRRGNIMKRKFPYIATALKDLPDASVIDGELVALDAQGRSAARSHWPNHRRCSDKTIAEPFNKIDPSASFAGGSFVIHP